MCTDLTDTLIQGGRNEKILIFVLAAVLSLAMLFSVTACGGSEVVDPVTVTISQETASVEVGSTVTLTANKVRAAALTAVRV